MNTAIKTSLKRKIKDALQTVTHIRSEYNRFVNHYILTKYSNKDGITEVYFRTKKDCWIVAKFFSEREFYLLFEQKNYSLIEIGGLSSIFIFVINQF